MTQYTSFSLTQTFPHPLHRLWQAWTDPQEMALWFWGSMTENPEATNDLRPNGPWQVAIDYAGDDDWPAGRIAMLGFYVMIRPMQELIYTVHWDANVFYNLRRTDCPDELVRVRFEEVDGHCRVDYEHSGFPDDGHSIQGHRDGTLDVFASLGGHLTAHP